MGSRIVVRRVPKHQNTQRIKSQTTSLHGAFVGWFEFSLGGFLGCLTKALRGCITHDYAVHSIPLATHRCFGQLTHVSWPVGRELFAIRNENPAGTCNSMSTGGQEKSGAWEAWGRLVRVVQLG